VIRAHDTIEKMPRPNQQRACIPINTNTLAGFMIQRTIHTAPAKRFDTTDTSALPNFVARGF
jgi:hypothetical protein